jgi:hypothetical protein
MESHLDTQAPPWTGGAGVKLVVGGFLALLGLLMTLDNLGIIDGDAYYRFWSLALILIGALRLAGGNWTWGLGLIVAGSWILALNLDWIRFTLFDLWPLLLIGGGVVMVAGALGYRPNHLPARAGSLVWATFSTPKVFETSRDFRGASLVAFLGGCQLDLTGADIAENPAVIDATAIWGGIEIFVPVGWEVAGEVVPVMGGFEIKLAAPERRPESSETRRQLIVRGVAFMGGIEVKTRRSA